VNFLSHHVVARRIAPNSPDAFFVGNVLPDIAQVRLKPGADGPLNDGIRLHLLSDRAFHSDAEFVGLCGVAGDLLRETPLSFPPRRVFFLAHVAVELALDSVLIRREPDLGDDLLTRIEPARDAALTALSRLRPDLVEAEQAGWTAHYDRFVEHRFVAKYGDVQQLVGSLVHLARRVGPDVLADGKSDRVALAEFFETLIETVEPSVDGLLERVGGAWYNSGAR
jgi:hypothetical protein